MRTEGTQAAADALSEDDVIRLVTRTPEGTSWVCDDNGDFGPTDEGMLAEAAEHARGGDPSLDVYEARVPGYAILVAARTEGEAIDRIRTAARP